MTLVVALACNDGIVFASEGQSTSLTSGIAIRQETTKILRFGSNKLWAAAGDVGVIQKIDELFKTLAPDVSNNPLSTVESRLKIMEYPRAIRTYQVNNRQQIYGTRKGAPFADLLIVESVNEPYIWYISGDCTDQFCHPYGYGAIGSGKIFADVILRRFHPNDYPIEKGSLIAYKVLKEALDISAYGLGEPIDIWTISKNNVRQKSEKELDSLRDAYASWTQSEEGLFKKLTSIL